MGFGGCIVPLLGIGGYRKPLGAPCRAIGGCWGLYRASAGHHIGPLVGFWSCIVPLVCIGGYTLVHIGPVVGFEAYIVSLGLYRAISWVLGTIQGQWWTPYRAIGGYWGL